METKAEKRRQMRRKLLFYFFLSKIGAKSNLKLPMSFYFLLYFCPVEIQLHISILLHKYATCILQHSFLFVLFAAPKCAYPIERVVTQFDCVMLHFLWEQVILQHTDVKRRSLQEKNGMKGPIWCCRVTKWNDYKKGRLKDKLQNGRVMSGSRSKWESWGRLISK